MKKYSILQISDLHKDQKLDYINLFSSLKSDCEEYMKLGIIKPEIIVVSGDLIEGAKGTNTSQEIENQYKKVEQFLDNLVKYFLNGDRSRIVIVPGNHDVNRELSLQSMQKSTSCRNDDYKRLRLREKDIRWSWDDFSFYYINDIELYKKRFHQFVEFYNRFYCGIRSIPFECEENGYIVDLDTYNISFVCFNSCYNLDHLNPEGCICPTAISRLHDELTNLNKLGRLIVGVWHHHISGLPSQNNYLDKRILREMITKHISLGLFGHQHISEIVNEYKDLSSQKKITLISSGSLYGRDMQLPTGVSRQYNVITINMNNHKAELTLNVRKDDSLFLYDIPTWVAGTIGNSPSKEFSFDIILDNPNINYIINMIDEEVRSTKDYVKACKKLKDLGLQNTIVSKYFDSYIREIDDYEFIISCIEEPNTAAQCIAVLNSAIELRRKDVLNTVLNYNYVINCEVNYVIDFRKRAIDLKNKL